MSRKLGSRYVLDDVIGKGASGKVWRGHDVDGEMFAFKVLRESIADDPDSVSRFFQERRILLSLRHPNLVQVHDLVGEGNTLALVMELVTGGDLRAYLDASGTLPADEACSLAAAMADGLAAMHAAGIIHRDIKPENILIDTSSGVAVPKITDFSIARIVSTAKQSTMMAGTPSYVAPELFDNKPPTVQSDLYSLGIVFYELLAGVPPFRSDSLLSMMKMHATESPPRPPGMSDHVWETIGLLLAKKPEDRVRDAEAAAHLLRTLPSVSVPGSTVTGRAETVQQASTVSTAGRAGPTQARPRPKHQPVATPPNKKFAVAVLASVVLLVVGAVVWGLTQLEVRAPGVAAPAAPALPCMIAFSRKDQIYVMDFNGTHQRRLDFGKGDAEDPEWSPDGKQIAFVVSYASADGSQGDIWVMNADGTSPRAVTGGAGDDRTPAWSPDGSRIAFTRWFEVSGNDDGDVYVVNVNGSGTTAIIEGDTEDGRPTWSPDGSEVAFVRWIKQADGGDDGDILIADADGSDIAHVTTGDANDNYPDWSPDGSRIAFMRPESRIDDAQTDIFVTDVDGSHEVALTHSESSERNPVWSPDGRRIAFARMTGSGDAEEGDIYVVGADGSNLVALTSTEQSDKFPSWSPGCTGLTQPVVRPGRT